MDVNNLSNMQNGFLNGERSSVSQFVLTYLGEYVLEKHCFNSSMLPWVMTAMYRQNFRRSVKLSLSSSILNCSSFNEANTILFQHSADSITRFTIAERRPKCFSYLVESGITGGRTFFACHLFEANEEKQIPSLFLAIREATLLSPKSRRETNMTADDFINSDISNSSNGSHINQIFKVYYVGRVSVSTKNVPPTFIDDIVKRLSDSQNLQSIQKHNVNTNSILSNTEESFASGGFDFIDQINSFDVHGNRVLLPASIAKNIQVEEIDGIPPSNPDIHSESVDQLIHKNPSTTTAGKQHTKYTAMFLQIGRNHLSLFDSDRCQVLLERNFSNISFCSQGICNSEYFGFISEDRLSASYTCHVFQCNSESVLEQVMVALKQAFHLAFQQQKIDCNLICDLCPINQFHRLCQEVEKKSAEQIHDLLQQFINKYHANYQKDILYQIQENECRSIEDVNEVMMSSLLHLIETRQKHHMASTSHDGHLTTILHEVPSSTNRRRSFCDELSEGYAQPDYHRSSGMTSNNHNNLFASMSSSIRRYSSPQNQNGGSSCLNRMDPSINSQPFDPFRNQIPKDSPMRSMFIKVGNTAENKSAPMKPQAAAPSRSLTSTPILRPYGLMREGPGSWQLGILSKVVSTSKSGVAADCRKHLKGFKQMPTKKMRVLWRKAILDTMYSIRVNKESKYSYTENEPENKEVKQIKLEYEEITPCLIEVTKVWDQMLETPNRSSVRFDKQKLINTVKAGIPRVKRGKIWLLLVEQHCLNDTDIMKDRSPDCNSISYQELLKQLTQHQHSILIDLGRTFPGHPYFSVQLGPGQLSLFNLLKAYSLLDQEVGYCQGISFVAGVLLMHIPEEKAFDVLKYMMFKLGFRQQYRPDMVSLQVQMYQLSRLLHDLHKDLYDHFEAHDITPTLYAAPWFLTIFASQFPLGFVGRVFDLIFLHGIEVVLKVSLVLLGNHKELIKQCNSFELIMEFLKTTLPEMGIIQMERIINQVFALDIAKRLEAYEVEYHVLRDEMLSLKSSNSVSPIASMAQNASNDNDDLSDKLTRLQMAGAELRHQKIDQLDQLEVFQKQLNALEDHNHLLLTNERKLKSRIRSLETERTALLSAVNKLRHLVPPDVLGSLDLDIPLLSANDEILDLLSPEQDPYAVQHVANISPASTSYLMDLDHEVATLTVAQCPKSPSVGNCNLSSRANTLVGRGRPASSNY